MAGKAAAPLNDGAVGQGRQRHLAGEPIGHEHQSSFWEQQAAYVERRFLLPAPIGRAVPRTPFGRAAA